MKIFISTSHSLDAERHLWHSHAERGNEYNAGDVPERINCPAMWFPALVFGSISTMSIIRSANWISRSSKSYFLLSSLILFYFLINHFLLCVIHYYLLNRYGDALISAHHICGWDTWYYFVKERSNPALIGKTHNGKHWCRKRLESVSFIGNSFFR